MSNTAKTMELAGEVLRKVLTEKIEREWVDLTDEDIAKLRRSGAHSVSDADFRDIESKLKEKNCG